MRVPNRYAYYYYYYFTGPTVAGEGQVRGT